MSRRLTVALGVGFALLGLAALVAPGLLAGIGLNDLVILSVGVVLVLGGVSTVRERFATDLEFAEFPDVEEAVELPTPGDDLNARIDDIPRVRTRRAARERVRREIAGVAVETLQRRYGIDETEAEAMLRSGEWTDDPYAAALFTRTLDDISRRKQLRELLRSEPRFIARARHAAAEIHDLAEGNDD